MRAIIHYSLSIFCLSFLQIFHWICKSIVQWANDFYHFSTNKPTLIFEIQLGWMRCSCKLTLVVCHAHLFVGRDGWITVCCLWGMVQRGSPFLDSGTSPIGSSRIHGARDGVKMAITTFAGAAACAESTQWSLPLSLTFPKCNFFFLSRDMLPLYFLFLLKPIIRSQDSYVSPII